MGIHEVTPPYFDDKSPAEPATPINDDYLRMQMLDWYIHSGFRGCLFNKLAARDASKGEFPWVTIVEPGSLEEIITSGDDENGVIKQLENVIGDGSQPGLVSYMFPGIHGPEQYVTLLRYLAEANPARYKILDVQDRSTLGIDGAPGEYVGIQFRIKLGSTAQGQDIDSYPMIYTPDAFTTFARRFAHLMIVFNRCTVKHNPDTPETYIGVDDIDLGLQQSLFDKLYERSIEVNRDAHSIDGKAQRGQQFGRNLFRAHNALVVPSEAWD